MFFLKNMEELDFVVSNKSIFCINLTKNFSDSMKFKLIDICFIKNPSFFLFHSNKEDNEKMLLLSEDSFKENEFIDYSCKAYNSIQIINTDAYLDDIGLVSKISSLFSENGISILYITTCQNNFIFVENSDLQKSLDLLFSLTKNVKILN